jgi:hypothetical protein
MICIITLAAAIIAPPIIFTDNVGAAWTLERNGFSDIKLTGYSPLGCDHPDQKWSTVFAATSPDDAAVTGIVCENSKNESEIVIETTSDPTETPVTDLDTGFSFLRANPEQ